MIIYYEKMETRGLEFDELYPTIALVMYGGKLIVIGVLMFGLLIGSLYFCYFLHKIWRLSRSSREFRENSEFMVGENLVRYFITIGCILTLDVLLFYNFEECETAMYVGAGIWGSYLGYFYLKDRLKNIKKGKNYKI